METLPLRQFDRDYDIHELLKSIDGDNLYENLSLILHGQVRLLDLDGGLVFGEITPGAEVQRCEIITQLEPIAYIEAATDHDLRATTALLGQLLRSAERYLMASELHLEAVQSDYEKLQSEHDALIDSEARYRDLAENLEQRVQQQVEVIENRQRQLLQSEKLASVGQLAAGVAHEINNPLGFILNNLNSAQEYIEEINSFIDLAKSDASRDVVVAKCKEQELDFILDDFKALLGESIDGAKRVARIVSDLKDFSNMDSGEERAIDLNAEIASAVNIARTNVSERVTISVTFNPLPLLTCCPGHVRQLLINMLLNSIAAVDDQTGVIEVTSHHSTNEIIVVIKDNGCGISEEILPKIFDPFFTTHDVGEGTGLGLTVARDVLTALRGDIEVSSIVGKGTTFTIHLPISD